MPRYVDLETRFTIDLPSTPDAHVWVPWRIPFDDETAILSKANRQEITNPLTGESTMITDPAVFQYELLHACLLHPDAGWDLFDANDQAYEINPSTINHLLKREDRQELCTKLARHHFPEMFEELERRLKEQEQEQQGRVDRQIEREDRATANETGEGFEEVENPLPVSTQKNGAKRGSSTTSAATR